MYSIVANLLKNEFRKAEQKANSLSALLVRRVYNTILNNVHCDSHSRPL